jgi:hypothetical protein
MRRLSLLVLVLFFVLSALPAQAAGVPNFSVPQVPPKQLQVGDSFTLHVHVPQQQGSWQFTLELMDPATHGRADFGGWVQSRRWQMAEPAAGDQDVAWDLKAGAPGRFRLFVHATPADDTTTDGWTSPGYDLEVQPAPAPNSAPMLGVAIGEPVLVGLWWLWQMRRRRLQRMEENRRTL